MTSHQVYASSIAPSRALPIRHQGLLVGTVILSFILLNGAAQAAVDCVVTIEPPASLKS